MKALKIFSMALGIAMLFQSCTVYKSTLITLDKAVQTESKVKIRTIDDENLKFNKIVLENGNYVGMKKNDGNWVKTPLDENNIATIREKDKALSTILIIAIPVAIIIGALVLDSSLPDATY